jgi:D-ribose pyranose/furanose isomerase RbsD
MDLDDYYLGKIPLPNTRIDNNIFTSLVDKMLSLNKLINEIGNKITDERARIEEKIKETDAKIDELVYKIYEITEAEKKIIEDSLK